MTYQKRAEILTILAASGKSGEELLLEAYTLAQRDNEEAIDVIGKIGGWMDDDDDDDEIERKVYGDEDS